MNIDAAVPPKRSGLALLWDTIVAPNAAFEGLRSTPKWLVAMIVTIVVGTIGIALSVPGTVHAASLAFQKLVESDPRLASLTPEKQQQATKALKAAYTFAPVVFPVATAFSTLVAAAVIFVATLVANARISFVAAFALAANTGFVFNGLFRLLVGLVMAVRGADSFASPTDIFLTLPSFAWFVPGADPKLIAFLAMINVFTIWSFALTVIGLRKMAGMRAGFAYAVAALFFLTNAGFAILGAAQR